MLIEAALDPCRAVQALRQGCEGTEASHRQRTVRADRQRPCAARDAPRGIMMVDAAVAFLAVDSDAHYN